jgi:hypothetical protein
MNAVKNTTKISAAKYGRLSANPVSDPGLRYAPRATPKAIKANEKKNDTL